MEPTKIEGDDGPRKGGTLTVITCSQPLGGGPAARWDLRISTAIALEAVAYDDGKGDGEKDVCGDGE